MGKVAFGVVGCGHIGKRHAEMVLRNDDTELVAICDILPEKQLDVAKFGVPFFDNFKQFLDFICSSSVENKVLSICVPNGLHASMAIEAIKAGCHVVIEKPMALSESDALHVLEVAEEYEKKVFCVMQNRYSPPSVWLKELITSNILGDIFLVQVNCFWNRDERYYVPDSWHGTSHLDGGTLFTQFSHFVDILYWLFGDIRNISAKFGDFTHQNLTEFEDTGIVHFEFTNGGLGSINYSTAIWDSNQESSLTIVAQNGSVRVGGQYMNEVEYCHIKNYVLPVLEPTNPGNDYGAYKGSAQNHHYVIQNVVDVLLHGGVITTDARDGVKVVSLIEQIYKHKN